MNRAARSIRSGSSLKLTAGSSGVRSRLAARSATPPNGSTSSRLGSDSAMALTVKSRRDRSTSSSSANVTSGLRESGTVGLGAERRDLEGPARPRNPIVPNRLPCVHTASAQPLTRRLDLVGPGVGGEVEVVGRR